MLNFYAPRTSRFTKARLDWALSMKASGQTWNFIAKELNLNRSSVQVMCQKYQSGLFNPPDIDGEPLVYKERRQRVKLPALNHEQIKPIQKDDIQFKYNSNAELSVFGLSNFHVDRVEVFSGPDECLMTNYYSFEPGKSCYADDQMEVTHCRPVMPKRIPFRVRGEPGVILYLKSEGSDDTVKVMFCHHKGHVYIKTDLITDDDLI